MTTRTRNIALSLIGVLVAAIVIIAVVRLAQPDSCGGVSRELGGCDDRYVFVATDCTGVGREFGDQLDARIAAILTGPETVADESRGVRMNHALTVGVTRANQHLKAAAIACDGSQVADAVMARISAAVKAGVGPAMYFGRPGTYDEWATEVRLLVAGIVDGTDTPASS